MDGTVGVAVLCLHGDMWEKHEFVYLGAVDRVKVEVGDIVEVCESELFMVVSVEGGAVLLDVERHSIGVVILLMHRAPWGIV